MLNELRKLDAKIEATDLLTYVLLVENVEYSIESVNNMLDNQARLLVQCRERQLWRHFHFNGVKYILKPSIKTERDILTWCVKTKRFFKQEMEAINDTQFQAAITYIRAAVKQRQVLVSTCLYLQYQDWLKRDLKKKYMDAIEKILVTHLTLSQKEELETRYYFYNRIIARKLTELEYVFTRNK